MKKISALIMLSILLLLFSACDEGMEGVKTNSTEQELVDDIKNMEQEVVERMSLIPTILDIEVVSVDNSSGSMDNCDILLYFSSSLIDQAQFDEESVAEKGTACGGSVEIYSTDVDALARDEYLAGSFVDMMSPGTHEVYGNIVVRISKKMTHTQQEEFAKLIYSVLKADDESELADIKSFTFSTDTENKDETSESQENTHINTTDEVIVPEYDYYYVGENYNTVIKLFQDMGFENVKAVEVKDITNDLFVKDGDVKEISIDGKIGFEKNQIFKKKSEVIITYRTYTDDARSKHDAEEQVKSNKENTESITVDNNNEFRELLNRSSISVDEWKAFAKKYEGRILEFDAVMNYTTGYEEGDVNISTTFYVVYNGSVVYDPYFWVVDVYPYNHGFEEFEFNDSVNTEQQPVHVKVRIKYYDDDFGYCIVVDDVDIKKR